MDPGQCMDLTPFLDSLEGGRLDHLLLSACVSGRVAFAMKGRFLLRSFCESFQDRSLIGCAVTDEAACLQYLAKEPYELLICTDHLEGGNGFELARKARQAHRSLKVVVLALGDVIPVEYAEAPWLEAVVAEADVVDDQRPLQAASDDPPNFRPLPAHPDHGGGSQSRSHRRLERSRSQPAAGV